MSINIEHHTELTNEQYLDDIWKLLCRYDQAFVPPLSARENTYQSNLLGGQSTIGKPRKYFETLKEQSFLIALNENRRVVGFMSYRPRYVCEDLEDNIETNYVTTIIVEEEQRGKGITTTFYKTLFARLDPTDTVTTRTWSTNNDHIHVLMKLGFDMVKSIEDSRGEGIDTVYYRKTIEGDSN